MPVTAPPGPLMPEGSRSTLCCNKEASVNFLHLKYFLMVAEELNITRGR